MPFNMLSFSTLPFSILPLFIADYWRMVMSTDDFVITPGCYDRQLDCDYRFSTETVTYDHLEDAREKCMDWILLNKEHFTL